MISNKFIHIHIPKTAGQFLRAAFKKIESNFDFLIADSHLTLRESREILQNRLPDSFDFIPSFCFVRNPWDWYVSRYFFRQEAWRKEKKRLSFSDIENFENNKQGFQDHMRLIDKLIINGEKAKSLNGKNVARIWQRLTISDFYFDMTDDQVDYIGKFEDLKIDLPEILNKFVPEVLSTLNLKSKVNPSSHANYQSYYNDELKEMVESWDKEYIERFDYEF